MRLCLLRPYEAVSVLVFDLCPSDLNVKVRAGLRRVTACASRLHARDAAVTFSGLRDVTAPWTVTLLALHVLKPGKLRLVRRVCEFGSGRVAVEAARFELEGPSRKRISRVSVRAV